MSYSAMFQNPEILQIRLKGLQVVVGCFHSVRPWVATAPLRMRKVTSNDVLKPLMPPSSVAIEVWSLHCPLKLQGQACCEDRGQVKLRIDKLLNSRDLLQRRMELGPIDTPKYFRTWKATGKIYSFLSGRLQKSRVPPFWCASMIVQTVYSCVLQVIWCTISIMLWCARHHGTKWIVHNTPCHFFGEDSVLSLNMSMFNFNYHDSKDIREPLLMGKNPTNKLMLSNMCSFYHIKCFIFRSHWGWSHFLEKILYLYAELSSWGPVGRILSTDSWAKENASRESGP